MKYRVPYIDYPGQYEKTRAEILATVDSVLSRGQLMLRDELVEFERCLAEFVGVRYAVGTGNCSDALYLALRAAGIGPGDEVITASHTFVATAAAIVRAGATAVFADIGADHLIDPEAVEAAITSRTKALLPVHLNGRLCDMNALGALARRHGLLVIEDAAQGLGAMLDGVKGGTFGLAGCFSFYPAKILGAFGDGGAVVTDDAGLAERIRALRNGGRSASGEITAWGVNSRLDNLQAAILTQKLRRLPEWIARRRNIAARYHDGLARFSNLVLPPPPVAGARFDVFQNYEIALDGRDKLRACLEVAGVETMLPWGGRAVHQWESLGFHEVRLPATERLFERVLLLPMHCELSDDQVDHVTAVIGDFVEENSFVPASCMA